MQVSDLVSLFVKAIESPDPHKAASAAMDGLRADVDALAEMLAYIPGTGGNAAQSFYRTPTLSLLKVCFPNGWRTAPHDHGTWASILLLSGCEKNYLYARDPAKGLQRQREVVLEKGSVLQMPADAIHVAECVGDEPAIGLHVYGGNVLGTERYMWDPDTLAEHPMEWRQYEVFKKKASAAASAP